MTEEDWNSGIIGKGKPTPLQSPPPNLGVHKLKPLLTCLSQSQQRKHLFKDALSVLISALNLEMMVTHLENVNGMTVFT